MGAILGKGGSNVKVIRSETKAFVSILWGKTAERVLEVNAPTVEPVLSATSMVIELMASLETDGSTLELRLLAQSANVGCLIGKGGSIVSEAVREHKVKSIKVDKDCIGASTEKVVTITGTSACVASAASWVISRLEEFPVREGAACRYHKPCASIYQAQRAGNQTPNASVQLQPQYAPIATPQGLPPPPPGYQYVQSAPAPAPVAATADVTTMLINVPTQCVAGLIGKRGSVITAIKKRSGANVSIKDSESALSDGTGSRQVVVTGTPQAVQAATQAIQERLNALQSA